MKTTKPEKLLLRVETPFNKNEDNFKNLVGLIQNVLRAFENRALPEHKYLMMNFVLSDEAVEENAEYEET